MGKNWTLIFESSEVSMQNKYRAVKSFMKSSRRLIREIDRRSLNISSAANVKGNLKVLDQSDYQKFSDILEMSNSYERDCKLRVFLIEKMASYKNYDFWPEDERLKQMDYKRERNKQILTLLNKAIDVLIKCRDSFGGKASKG